jgi:hypothetical protein
VHFCDLFRNKGIGPKEASFGEFVESLIQLLKTKADLKLVLGGSCVGRIFRIVDGW